MVRMELDAVADATGTIHVGGVPPGAVVRVVVEGNTSGSARPLPRDPAEIASAVAAADAFRRAVLKDAWVSAEEIDAAKREGRA